MEKKAAAAAVEDITVAVCGEGSEDDDSVAAQEDPLREPPPMPDLTWEWPLTPILHGSPCQHLIRLLPTSMLICPPPSCTLPPPNAALPTVAVISANGEGRGRRGKEVDWEDERGEKEKDGERGGAGGVNKLPPLH